MEMSKAQVAGATVAAVGLGTTYAGWKVFKRLTEVPVTVAVGAIAVIYAATIYYPPEVFQRRLSTLDKAMDTAKFREAVELKVDLEMSELRLELLKEAKYILEVEDAKDKAKVAEAGRIKAVQAAEVARVKAADYLKVLEEYKKTAAAFKPEYATAKEVPVVYAPNPVPNRVPETEILSRLDKTPEPVPVTDPVLLARLNGPSNEDCRVMKGDYLYYYAMHKFDGTSSWFARGRAGETHYNRVCK